MSYYLKDQTVKYQEDRGPTVVVLAADELEGLLRERAVEPRLARKLERRYGEFFGPKLVLQERGRDIALCQQVYDQLVAALEAGLDGEDVALLLSSAEYDLYGPTGAHGGMSDEELPEGAVDHDAYWQAHPAGGSDATAGENAAAS